MATSPRSRLAAVAALLLLSGCIKRCGTPAVRFADQAPNLTPIHLDAGDAVEPFAFSPDGTYFLVHAGIDDALYALDVGGGTNATPKRVTTEFHPQELRTSAEEVWGSAGAQIGRFQRETLRFVKVHEDPKLDTQDKIFAVSNDGRFIARKMLLDTATGGFAEWRLPAAPITVSFSAQTLFAAGYHDSRIVLHNARTGKQRALDVDDRITAAGLSPKGRTVIAGTEAGKVLLWQDGWDEKTPPLNVEDTHKRPSLMQWSEDGQFVAWTTEKAIELRRADGSILDRLFIPEWMAIVVSGDLLMTTDSRYLGIWKMTGDGAKPILLTELPEGAQARALSAKARVAAVWVDGAIALLRF